MFNAEQADDARTAPVTHIKSHLALPSKDGLVYVEYDSLVFLRAERSYAHVHCRDIRYLVSLCLRTLEGRLPASRFFRCHRSYLINVGEVRRLILHGGSRVEMSSGHEVEVSRRRLAALKEVLARW